MKGTTNGKLGQREKGGEISRKALYPNVRNLGFSLHGMGGHGKVLNRGNDMVNLSFSRSRLLMC